MRKVLAWLGAAALVVLWSVSVHADSSVLKPYVVLILDTSGSMVRTDGFGNPTGFGPPSCGGIDNKLNHAKCAIYNIANSYGDIDLGLARFRNAMSGTTTSTTFPSGCCSHGPDAGACGGQSYACSAGDSMFELLAPIIDGTNAQTAVWVNDSGDTCTASGDDPEIWNADSNTPLGGVLLGAKDYWSGVETATDGVGATIWPSTSAGFAPIGNDPTNTVFLPKSGQSSCNPNPDTCDTAASCTGANCCCVSQCRPYITILLTDGDETCGGNAVNAATSLLTTDIGSGANKKRYRVITKAIGFGVTTGDSQIEAIAHAGGAADVPNVNEGYYAQDEAGLELAISEIIEGSVRSEVCNDLDDDCDTRIDEDFPNKGGACDNGLLGKCKGTGNLGCRADGTGVECDITNPGQSPTPEICNNDDDDCDGKIDEGLSGCVCNPAPEICDGLDQDCDGVADNGIGSRGCAITNSFGTCPGTQTCAATPGCTGDDCYTTCTGQTPGPETCDGVDNNCDGICDGFSQGCSDIVTPKGPASDNPGDPSNNPIPQNVCHPGQMLCSSSCSPGNTFGNCVAEEQGCNPSQDPNVHCDICNGLDDDCDNRIDEDFVGQDCSTNCGVGQTQCTNGTVTCNSMPAGDDDTCDGVDDDCDGQTDEDWVCDPSPSCVGPNCCTCGTGTTCELTQCLNGQPTCTQTQPIDPEQCNCDDDDCDGQTDEDVTCGAGGACVDCQCAFPCGQGEFPCPMGKKCDTSMGPPGFCVTDPCYGVSCGLDGSGNAQTCQPKASDPTMAECVEACTLVSCPTGFVCYGPTGECRPDDCTTFPDRCAANQVCVVDSSSGFGECVTNLCQGVTCPADQYCEAGNCVASCADVTCPDGQRCRLGVCETDPCGHACPFGQACHDDSGECIDDPCPPSRQCPQGQWCNPNDGQCEADPCVGTMCPSPDQVCKGGTCYSPEQFLPDAGVDQHVTVGGGGGCSTTGGDGGLLLGLAMLFARRRRRQGGAQ